MLKKCFTPLWCPSGPKEYYCYVIIMKNIKDLCGPRLRMDAGGTQVPNSGLQPDICPLYRTHWAHLKPGCVIRGTLS